MIASEPAGRSPGLDNRTGARLPHRQGQQRGISWPTTRCLHTPIDARRTAPKGGPGHYLQAATILKKSIIDDSRLRTSSFPMFRAYSLAVVLLRPQWHVARGSREGRLVDPLVVVVVVVVVVLLVVVDRQQWVVDLTLVCLAAKRMGANLSWLAMLGGE